MTFDDSYNVADWDATQLLQIINPDNLSFCCVGYAPSQHRRCRNPIAQHNRAAAMCLLESLPSIASDLAALRQKLSYLAGLALCRSFHQNQVADMVQQWYARIAAHLQKIAKPGYGLEKKKKELDRLECEEEELREAQKEALEQVRRRQNEEAARQLAENKRRQEAQRQAQRQREEQQLRTAQQEAIERAHQQIYEEAARQNAETECRQEARRQAQCQREEQEAESRRRIEREQARQRAHLASQRQDHERQQRVEQEARSWSESWTQYEEEWAQILRLKAMTSSQMRDYMLYPLIKPLKCTYGSGMIHRGPDWQYIIRAVRPECHPRNLAVSEDPDSPQRPTHDMVPWPVKGGTWQEVNERNVEDFFRHASVDAKQDPGAVVKLLRSQAMRWHPDRMCRFPRLKESECVMSSVTLVAQVINEMVRKARADVTSKEE